VSAKQGVVQSWLNVRQTAPHLCTWLSFLLVHAAYNFDHPSAFDSTAIVKCLRSLQHMQQVDVPIYDFITHQRSSETRRVEPADVVIIEGIMVLHMEEVRQMLNMKIYVDTDDDVRLARRLVCLTASCSS